MLGGIGGLGKAGGGIGIAGVIIYLLITLLASGGGGSSLASGIPDDRAVSPSALAGECRTGADANRVDECRIVAAVNSVQDYWESRALRLPACPDPVLQRSGVDGLWSREHRSGPLLCSADGFVYLDLAFFDQLRTQFGATGGPFAQSYVIAHEYGHHIQDLLGTLAKANAGTRTGARERLGAVGAGRRTATRASGHTMRRRHRMPVRDVRSSPT